MISFKQSIIGAALTGMLVASGPTSAIELLNGFGGDRGFGELAMNPNDDLSSNQLNLPFAVNFFGNTYDKFFINNNGNISFNGSLGTYTPSPFPIGSQPMIAPFWGDVDTRGGSTDGSNNVWVASPNASTVVVTWDNVGYYSNHTDKQNSFQLVLTKSATSTTAGDFDVQFRYKQLQWTTGDASSGSNGLGGTPAQAGYDAGNGTDYYMLPGSRTGDVLNLVNTSNVNGSSAGLWEFAVRNGALPGSSASNPILPTYTGGTSPEAGYSFNFGVRLGQTVFIDPLVAIGYDYVIGSGPNAASVLLPNIGDGRYDLWFWYGDHWADSGVDLTAGTTYNFGRLGVSRFSIRGIETSAGLNPGDSTAFVTGLTFVNAGTVSMTMTPITAAVPEPETYAMFLAGLGVMGAIARRRRTAK